MGFLITINSLILCGCVVGSPTSSVKSGKIGDDSPIIGNTYALPMVVCSPAGRQGLEIMGSPLPIQLLQYPSGNCSGTPTSMQIRTTLQVRKSSGIWEVQLNQDTVPNIDTWAPSYYGKYTVGSSFPGTPATIPNDLSCGVLFGGKTVPCGDGNANCEAVFGKFTLAASNATYSGSAASSSIAFSVADGGDLRWVSCVGVPSSYVGGYIIP